MTRTVGICCVTLLTLVPASGSERTVPVQGRAVPALVTELSAGDPMARARAACELREIGDGALPAIQPLVGLLGDAAPIESSVCGQRWWRGEANDLTSPGEQAAAALVAIGTRAFQPVLGALRSTTWAARRNAAWALGALDDQRAVEALVETLKDREPGVREQAVWALGALDASDAVPALTGALKDPDPRVRRQAAWALGAIDDRRGAAPLVSALADEDDRTREQAAWALGALDEPSAVPALIKALGDSAPKVRQQAAWALGAIDDRRAVDGLVRALTIRAAACGSRPRGRSAPSAIRARCRAFCRR